MKCIFLFTLPLLLSINHASAATRTLTGSGTVAWTAANWGGGLPASGDGCTITPTGNLTITGVPTVSISSLTISASNYTVTLQSSSASTITLTSSTTTFYINSNLTLGNYVSINCNADNVNATLNIAAGKTFNVGANSFTFKGGIISNNTTNKIDNAAGGVVTFNRYGNQAIPRGTYNGTLVLGGSGVKTWQGYTSTTCNGTLLYTGTATTSGTGGISVSNTTTVEYAGSGAQTINQADYDYLDAPGVLKINNTFGVTLAYSRKAMTLNMAAGLLNLGNYNLTLTTGSAVAGSPFSATKMVRTNGTGYLINTYATGGSFTYPIGESSNYTPVSLSLSNNTASGTVGARVTNSTHPNMNTPVAPISYLSRYWSFNSNGLGTNYSYTGTFSYPSANISGTESQLKYSVWNTSSWFQHDAGSSATSNVLTISTPVTYAMAPLSYDVTGRYGMGCTDPTLSGASQASAVCGSGSATINLTGMVANSTGNAIDYTINGVAQPQVTGINADGSGNASFSTSSLTTANNGQALVITKITNGSCYTDFSQTVTLNVKSKLNGDYTIAPAGDYQTFAAAVSDLINCGVDPAATYVTFTASSATYNEQIAISTFSNPNNVDVTFQSLTGNNADVTLTYPSSSSVGNNYTLQVNGADHLIFKNMTIARTGSNTYANVVNISGDASYNRFDNIIFSGRTGSYANTAALVYSDDNNTGNANNTFDGCYFLNGSAGIWYESTSTSYLKPNLTVQNSTFENYRYGMYMEYLQGVTITGNTFTNAASYNSASTQGIYAFYVNNALSITRNTFVYTSSTNTEGIELQACVGTAGYVGDVSNNMIIVGGTNTVNGINAGSLTAYKNIYFNSVYNTGTNASSASALYQNGSSNTNIQNNILYATVGLAIEILTTGGIGVCDYNDLYSTGANLGYWSANRVDLAAWQSASGKDAHSVSGDPAFTSATDLHCTSGSASSNAGIVIAGISNDFDGDNRQTGTAPVDGPDIGADEFSGCIDLTWTGTLGTDWDTPGNWSCLIVPTSTSDITIPDVANQPEVSSTATSVCRSITIDAGASVTVNSGKDLSVYGNWTNNGVSDVGTGTVVFTVSTPQAQTINGATTFGNLTINNSSGVTINDPTQVTGVLTPTSGTLICTGMLTLKSSSSGTALIAGTGSGSVTGQVTMERYMASRLGYHYYSSPFTNTPITEFTDELGTLTTGNPYINDDFNNNPNPFPNFFLYNEGRDVPFMNIGWEGAGANLDIMRGYCINFGVSTTPLTTTVKNTALGPVNSGAYNFTVTHTTSSDPSADGWNLVGNPYASPIDWLATNGWTKANVDDAVYCFKPSTQYAGTYTSFVNGNGTNDGSRYIASMQGFFVKAKISAGPSGAPFGVTNDVRIPALTSVFHKTLSNNPSLRLKGYNAANAIKADETVIYFDPLATFMFDSNLDAYKMLNNDPTYPNIFSRDSSIYSLSISALPPLTNTDVVIPLGFTTKTSGTYTIEATEMLNFDPSLHIYLEDNQTSTIQDLTLNPQYTFSINVNDPLYRFFIRFSPAILTGIEENGSSFAEAWSSGKDIFVNYSNPASQKTEISIYNMLGQKVISSEQAAIGTSQFTIEEPGCYIVNLISGSKIYQKKVVIL